MSGYSKLLRHIKKYESVTFSVSEVGMTGEEVEKVADALIDRLIGFVDGPMLEETLDIVRNGK